MIPKSTTVPMFIYGTRHGSFYNLTPTNLPKAIPAVQLCYGDFHDYTETIKSLPEGLSFKKFLSFPENVLTYLTPYDFSKPDCMSGCHQDTKVKIKCNKGYTQVTAQMYDNMVDIIKPDMFVGLTQYPSLEKNHEQNSNKSYKRAINKTKSYLQLSKYTRDQQNDNKEGKPIRLAALHGGTNLSLISRSLEQILNYAIEGIVVCDLCSGETLSEREEVFKIVLARLEQEYNRQNSYFKNKKLKLVLAGHGHLQDIEHALQFGFEAFEINHPFLVAESQKALIFNKETGKVQVRVPVRKQQLKPLDPDCKCYACLNHNESYIAHLIDCYELTAKVLLSVHNIQVYEDWLRRYREVNGLI